MITKKKIPFLFLIISIILFLYTFYRSEIIFNGSRIYYYISYYLLSLFFFGLAIISYYINNNIIKIINIFLISIVVSFYIFEFYSIFNNTYSDVIIKKKINLKKIYNLEYDQRTKLKVYSDLKKKGKYTINLISSQIDDLYTLSGISNMNTIYCNESGFYSIYKSDRYGFNNPDKEWEKKNINYLLIGDSYAQGACVNRPNDIASVIRNISKKGVISLGFDNNGPLTELATLREYNIPNVKNVIWLYYEGNDFDDLYRELENKILNKYLVDLSFKQNLKFKQKKIDSLLKDKVNEQEKNYKKKIIINYFKLTNLRKLLYSYAPKNVNFKEKKFKYKIPKEFESILRLVKDICEKNNSQFYFVYIPISENYKSKDLYERTISITNKLNIKTIDIYKEVHKKEANVMKLFPLEISGHYNEYGYKKIAEAILNYIQDE